MSRINLVVCNKCKKEVKPPENAGWLVVLAVAPDGVSFADAVADICSDCRVPVVKECNATPSRLVS